MITFGEDQTEKYLAWAGKLVEAHFNADCGPPSIDLFIQLLPIGHTASGGSGKDIVEFGDVDVELVDT